MARLFTTTFSGQRSQTELKLLAIECRYRGMASTPNPEVIKAFAYQLRNLSSKIEMLARRGREWLDDGESVRIMWAASSDLHALSTKLISKITPKE